MEGWRQTERQGGKERGRNEREGREERKEGIKMRRKKIWVRKEMQK